MKIALCFIINYDHILNKEHLWREWITPNKDIINVYFYYKSIDQIKSEWIRDHTIPLKYIYETSYYYVIPAYMSLMNYAMQHDAQNKWFCMLTDSCCPIISPTRFRYLFFTHYHQSVFSWKYAWWNPYFHKRANLEKLSRDLWLANDPWFVLTKENVKQLFYFMKDQPRMVQSICDGGLANESLFAIIFKYYGELQDNCNNNNGNHNNHHKSKHNHRIHTNNTDKKNKNNKNKDNRIICKVSHLTDWTRPSSTTSPHLFKEGNEQDVAFLNNELERNKYAMFVRKIDPSFPDPILRYFIYEKNKKEDEKLLSLSSQFQFQFTWYEWCFIIAIGMWIIHSFFLIHIYF
jgi:hypothetical protein